MTTIGEQLTADAQTVIDASRTEVKTLITPVYNVKGYGAKGNGVTDDTKAIQDALDEVHTRGGGTVYFPKGTYIVKRSSPVGDYNYCLLIKSDRTLIVGDGKASVIKLADGETGGIIMRTVLNNQDVDGVFARRLSHLTVRDLCFDGNWSNITWGGPLGLESEGVYDQNGLDINTTDHVVVDNVYIRNCGHDGLVFANCRDVLVRNCLVDNTGKNNLAAFLTASLRVRDSFFSNPNSSPDPSTKPVYNTSSSKYACIGLAYAPTETEVGTTENDVIITGNSLFPGAYGRGIGADSGANNLIIKGNTVESQSGIALIQLTAASLSDNYANYIIKENIFRNMYHEPGTVRTISLVNLKTVLVEANIISDGQNVFDNCSSLTVRGNKYTASVANDYALNFRSCVRVDIANNTCENGKISFTNTVCDDVRINGNRVLGFVYSVAPTNLTVFDNPGFNGNIVQSVGITGFIVPANSVVTKTVTVTGVTTKDVVLVANVAGTLGSLSITPMVTATNTVSINFHNPTGTDIAVGGATWYVVAIRYGGI